MQSNSHMMDFLYRRGITPAVIDLFDVSLYEHPQIGECIRIPYSEHHAKYRRDPNDPRKPKYLYDVGGKVTLYGADKLLGSKESIDKCLKIAEDMRNLFPGKEHHLTGTELAILNQHNTLRPKVVITEGELDTLVLWSQNIPAVSSTGGAMSWQEEWSEQLKHYQVYVCFDNDDAGMKGMIKVLKSIPTAAVILVPEIPDVKDISDYVSRGGNFRDLMATALHNVSVETVEEDMARRRGMMLSTRFHKAYLEEMQQTLHKTTYTPDKYEGDDKVLKARSFPMTDLIEFRRRKACCPWHNEKTPSLHYYPKTNTAYCFGQCGRAYDAIDAYMMKHNCNFKTAISEMNKYNV